MRDLGRDDLRYYWGTVGRCRGAMVWLLVRSARPFDETEQ